MYKKIDFSNGFVSLEKDICNLWDEKDIVKKSLLKNPDGECFTFYDGPPTANGAPHIGHVLTRAIKDIIPRYKVMKGYNVPRKAGWDTHGLPVEIEIEKQLNISGKSGIEEYGVEKFIEKCKSSVFKYVNLWEDMSEKVGYWVDMEHPYITYENNYIESVWWALKQMWNKDYIYKGHKIMPYCPRCGTPLSSHEVAQGYKDVTEQTAFAKFKVKNTDNKYILAWTTTPWTLPSNTALTLNKAYTYIEAKVNGEIFILAEGLKNILGDKDSYEIVKTFSGTELLGLEYEQLLPYVQPEGNAFKVIHGDYVTLDAGTGIVHTAPAYGEEDNMVAKQNDIATLHLVDATGRFIPEVGEPLADIFVKDADKIILKTLKDMELLFKSESFSHSYPHCWRCETPLLYYPQESWFIASTKYKDQLVNNNQKINWLPENIKNGRFGNFLDSVIDWGFSRSRYWGTPLPIWECECGHRHFVGSIEELYEKGINVEKDIELHKPYIDNVKLKCDKCAGEMSRTPEVIDAWFDSGSMPFAQYHYPFENKEFFEKNFPAQFISEAIDQTRGWFYSLHNISSAIFETNAFENCIVMGLVLDGNGEKMGKSKGNAIAPDEILDSIGADALRWHFYSSSSPWIPKRLSAEDVAESQRKYILNLANIYAFYTLYANVDNFNPYNYKDAKTTHVMDKWVLSKLNSTIKEIESCLDSYLITPAADILEKFIDDVSNWYIRRNRARFWQEGINEDKISVYKTLHTVLVTLAKISAPFIPFLSEEFYQNLVFALDKTQVESVHLCKWPESDDSLINADLEAKMEKAITIVRLGRSARNNVNIKNRQPLSKMQLSTDNIEKYYVDIIKEELNIKKVEVGANIDDFVDYEIKPNLPIIGKSYGKYIPEIRKALSEVHKKDLVKTVDSGKTFILKMGDNTQVELNKDNILVSMEGHHGFAFAGEGDIGVVLDTTITEELKNEGYLREILSKIQNMRKDNGFEVIDRINLYTCGDEKLEEIIKHNEDFIKKEVLSDNIFYREKTSDTPLTKVNDREINLFVEKV